mmetsp:Transcript_30626/g.67074  ORF Transcript_30626/g.67074 Transcript_30626/m.67074 type:complete len:770 (+) Transcript_30626:104-2413(+)
MMQSFKIAIAISCVVAALGAIPRSAEVYDHQEVEEQCGLQLLQERVQVLPGPSRARRAPALLREERSVEDSDDAAAVESTTDSPEEEEKKATAAEMSGVATNAAGDLGTFLTALGANIAMLLLFFLIASVLRRRYPLVYSGNVVAEDVPFTPEDSLFGWWTASAKITIDQVEEYAGLDQAMLLCFAQEAMRLLTRIGIPLVFIVGPLHWKFGGNRSGDDNLSKWGMANVVDGHPWLYWLHGALVWAVVLMTQNVVFGAMGRFLVRRDRWLKEMPAPRSTTVLVEGIPEDKCSDKLLKEFFDGIFESDVVEDAHMMKDTAELLEAISVRDAAQLKLNAATFKSDQEDMAYYKKAFEDAEKEVKEARALVKSKADTPGGVNLTTGFVTFKCRRDAELAKMMAFTPDEDEYDVEIPPDPADIIYTDLQADPAVQQVRNIIGYSLLVGVFWAYMPCVLGIAYFTSLGNLSYHFSFFEALAESPSIAALWDGLVQSIALQLFMAFVPTFFVLIFSNFFILKAEAWAQHRIQDWYFRFQVTFVLLVTAVGSSLMKTAVQLAKHPTSVFVLLANTLPLATHFYLNFLPLQWVTHGQNLMRMVQLFKFKAFAAIYEEPEAKKHSEPEDQDYYGMGARSARFAFMLVLALVFSTLTPLITVLGYVNFFICRKVYGYLTVFAETRKPDLGGVFFVTQLTHVQQSMFIYIVLMTGVLLQRATNILPGLLAGSTFIYMYISYHRFFTAFRWESLTFQDLLEDLDKKRGSSRSTYRQPELCE